MWSNVLNMIKVIIMTDVYQRTDTPFLTVHGSESCAPLIHV